MSLITLSSAAGSPGVSTTAIGLSLAWPRPCLLVEADPSGASAILTGYMRQYAPNGVVSIFDLAVRFRQTGSIPPLMDVATRVPNTSIGLLSGPRSPAHAAAIGDAWNVLIAELKQLDAGGIDVLVDLGRLGLVGSPTALLHAADLNLLVTRSTLPALVPAKHWAERLVEIVGADSGRAGLLLIGPGQPYNADDVGRQLKLPVTTTLPMDPTTAEVFHLGAKAGRRFDRSPLYRSLPPAAAAIRSQIEAAKRSLQGEQL